MIRALLFLAIVLCVTESCYKKSIDALSEESDAYAEELAQKRSDRVDRLTRPQGWLSLVGLHWLEEGVNTIGGAADNTIVFSQTDTETIGAYQVAGDDIFFGKVEGVDVSSEGQEYLGGPVEVGYPHTIANHGSLYWYVIKRGEKYAIRLRDTLSMNRLTFEGIPYFPTNRSLVVNARVEKPEADETVLITNVLGHTSDTPVAAYLHFEIDNKKYKLAALDEGGDSYFVIFGDPTNGVTSYGGGRFIYPNKPVGEETTVLLDFNLAVNPPCVFTDFATCPLPPEINKLSVAINAGEMNDGHQ